MHRSTRSLEKLTRRALRDRDDIDIRIEHGGKHYKVYIILADGRSRFIVTAVTPSDVRGELNFQMSVRRALREMEMSVPDAGTMEEPRD